MVGDPAGGAAPERVDATKESVAPDPLYRFARGAAAHGDNDGPVFQRRGQATDEGNHARAPSREDPGFMARRANDEGSGASVARVGDASERQIGEQERVRLIHDEGRGEALDGAVEGGGRDVGRSQGPLGQRARQVFGRRLAAALERGAEGEDRSYVEGIEGVGKYDPQREGFSPAIR